MSTGLIFDGVAASQALDSQGERLDILGCDCSAWDTPEGIQFNYEHAPTSEGPGAIVGRVIYLKKIYERSDCEDDRQRMYWDRVKMPLIYVKGRLWDGAGHEGAKAVAAIMRDNAANNEPLMCRLSIEGSTLRREGGDLLDSMCLAIAITMRPANKTADTALLEDPNAPEGYEKRHDVKKVSKLLEAALKSEPTLDASVGRRLGGTVEFVGNPIVEDPLSKGLESGSYDAAPSSLTGGAALQREVMDGSGSKKKKDNEKALDALRRYMTERTTFDKTEFRSLLRSELPNASDEYLDHFEKIVDDVRVSRSQVKKADSMVLLDSWGIQLKKSLTDLRSSILFGDPRKPTIYSVNMKVGDGMRLAGRFMLINNELSILEDYFGLIAKAIPEGPLTSSTVNMIQAMQQSPELEVKETPYVPPEPQGDEVEPQPEAPPPPAPVRAPVFDYHRVGFDEPHTVEYHDGNGLLDAKLITPEEVSAILANVSSGAATLRYKAPDLAGTIARMEEQFGDLAKGMRQPPCLKTATAAPGEAAPSALSL